MHYVKTLPNFIGKHPCMYAYTCVHHTYITLLCDTSITKQKVSQANVIYFQLKNQSNFQFT